MENKSKLLIRSRLEDLKELKEYFENENIKKVCFDFKELNGILNYFDIKIQGFHGDLEQMIQLLLPHEYHFLYFE